MRFPVLLPSARLVILGFLFWLATLPMEAANNVAPPNLLWHNKVTGENRVWLISGTNITSSVNLPSTADDPTWKLIGTGDFDGDGNPDIVWQNETTGQNAVWYMNGTLRSSTAVIQSAGDMNWKLVGVADFNGDGKPDLLWQNLNTVQNAIWLMNNTAPISFNLIVSNGDVNWRIVATGDLNGDGKPDIILRNSSTGQSAVWYMNGLNMISGDTIRTTLGGDAIETDQDWKIVGTADINGDGKPDLIWRHATLGLDLCWFMNGNVVTGSSYLSRQEFDTNWKNPVQDTADSTWRLQTASYTYARATLSTSPLQVTINFSIPANSGFGSTVQRRLTTVSSWTTLVSGFQGTNYNDTTVALGQRYEYRVYREGFGGTQYSSSEHCSAAVNAAPLENRGKVILLVDQTLSSSLTASLDQLNQDLVGDGWTVLRYDVPRHIDDYSSNTSYGTNAYNITKVIKPLILSAYSNDPTNTRAVLIVGHVAIPYSGTFSDDGHTCTAGGGPDHQGAWPADMFYGDVDGTWTDTSANYTNCVFPEPNNVPGDGKFDQDGIASPFIMRLGVGRIDFARLPVFTSNPPAGTSPVSEVALIQRYLNKDHLFRLKQLSWQQGNPSPLATVYGNFHDSRDNPIFENAAAILPVLGSNPTALSVGDFALQRTKSYLWGYMSGAGSTDRINDSIPIIQHAAVDLTNPANEPSAAFVMLLASFLGDWNLQINNYLRSLLATSNYGLASMWTRFGLWRTDSLGLGEHLGACLTRMVNDPKSNFYDRARDLTILGDPTLRMHILTPVSSVTGNSLKGKVQLSWGASEAGAQYLVYRAANNLGPFTRISPTAISTTSFADNDPSIRQKVYMVRAIKPVSLPMGTFTNISQGVTAPVK